MISLIVLTLAAELKPLSVEENRDQNKADQPAVLQVFRGINSNLKAPARIRISDAAGWQEIWFRHHDIQAIRGRNPHPVPEIDFSRHMVIGIVEKSAKFRRGIQVERINVDAVRKGRGLYFDYAPELDRSRRSPRPENVYGFFVIPRYDLPVSIRRATSDGWKTVTQLGALPVHEPGQNAITATSDVSVSGPGLLKSGPMPGRVQSVASPASVNSTRHVPNGALNIGFAYDPYQGNYDGVVGSPGDVWNFVDIGTTAVDYMRHPDATGSTARLRISRHDGEWAIKGHSGIFKGYIYHNCQCVDLEATLLDLAPSRYRVYVYAHGDAPDQNARVEVLVNDRSIGQKATANDGTWKFQDEEFQEGVQYVSFEFDVRRGETVRIISHRDGSDYSMLNAIQLVPVIEKRSGSSPELESTPEELIQAIPTDQ